MNSVLDASALLAYLRDERGSEKVGAAFLQKGVLMSAINMAEVLSRTADEGKNPAVVFETLSKTLLRLGAMEIIPVDGRHALGAAQLRAHTRSLGLSLADRVCLALAKLHKLPVLTTDSAWKKLNIGVKVEVIR